MSDVYDEIKERATLDYRLGFARRVLRAELFITTVTKPRATQDACPRRAPSGALLSPWTMCVAQVFGFGFAEKRFRVGEVEPGSSPPRHCYVYTEVGRNVEGKKTDEAADMFADLSDDSDDDY